MAEKEKNLSQKAREWCAGKEGAESLRKSIEKAIKDNEKFKMCRQISPEILRRPFTI